MHNIVLTNRTFTNSLSANKQHIYIKFTQIDRKMFSLEFEASVTQLVHYPLTDETVINETVIMAQCIFRENEWSIKHNLMTSLKSYKRVPLK